VNYKYKGVNMKKRGAVEISLSMIIIIIIAVIVLISGLGLITGGLDRVKEMWERALKGAESELQEQPSFDQPIVWSLGDVATVKTGKEYVVEVAVLNTGGGSLSGKLSLKDCKDSDGTSTSNIKLGIPNLLSDLPSGEIGSLKGTFKVLLGTPQETYICNLVIGDISEEIAITTT